MALKTVLFDLGGTLLHYHDRQLDDPQRPFHRVTVAGVMAVLERLAENGVALPSTDELSAAIDQRIGMSYMADWQARRGGSIEEPIRAELAAKGIDLTDAEWGRLRPALYHAIDQIVFPRQGLHETLQALHQQGYHLGVISNTHWAADLHDRHLQEHQIFDLLPLRLYSCDTPYMKPHPGIFHLALDRLGLLPDEAVYVGDRPDVDVAAAQQVGLRGVLIRSPYQTQYGADHTDSYRPDAVIDELPDLIPALEWLEARTP